MLFNYVKDTQKSELYEAELDFFSRKRPVNDGLVSAESFTKNCRPILHMFSKRIPTQLDCCSTRRRLRRWSRRRALLLVL